MQIEVKPWICPSCGLDVTDNYYSCTSCHREDGKYHIINRGTERMGFNKNERLAQVFRRKSDIVLPVLACRTFEQFQKNIAFLLKYKERGTVHGVWLTTTNCSVDTVAEVIQWMKQELPSFWVGVNLLGEAFDTIFPFLQTYHPDGLWMDMSYVTEKDIQTEPTLIVDQLSRISWNGLYFGGVLFKYIPERGDPVRILRNSIPYMDVLCTSGDATGVPISDKKLDLLTNTIRGDIPIAVASGISHKNVHTLKEKIQVYMFRSSCVDQHENIVPHLFHSLILSIHR